MTIQNVINNSKEDGDIQGIKVSICNKNELTFFDNPKEVYFGELAEIPEAFMEFDVKDIRQICASSVYERNGAYIIEIEI